MGKGEFAHRVVVDVVEGYEGVQGRDLLGRIGRRRVVVEAVELDGAVGSADCDDDLICARASIGVETTHVHCCAAAEGFGEVSPLDDGGGEEGVVDL